MKSHGKKIDLQDKLSKLLEPTDINDQIKVKEMIINSVIMEQIDFYLKDKGLNRSDLAKILGVSKSYVSQLFSCNKTINLNMIAAIEKHLDLSFFIKITPPLYSTFCETEPLNEGFWKQVDVVRDIVEPSDQDQFKKLPKRAINFNGES